MNQPIHDRVLQIIAKNQKISLDKILLDQPITELCHSSLDLVSLLFALEDEFDLDIMDEAHEAKTVRDIIHGIEHLMNTESSEA